MEIYTPWEYPLSFISLRPIKERMIDIALPKGSLEEATLTLFKEADLEVRRTERDYNPKIADPRIGKVKILRPQEIPIYVQNGYFDLGISGQDWVKETGADVVEVARLSYSKQSSGSVRIVLAVAEDWDINSAREIPPHSRISTEYPRITAEFFENLGIPVEIFFSYGATEAKVPDLMDAIVDLTETGSTLRKNGLKIIDTLLESYTVLIANKNSWDDPQRRKEIEEIKTLLLGVIQARGKVLLTMNVAEDKLDQLIEALPSLKMPTISKLYHTDYYAVETVVDKREVNILIPKLKSLGAEDILEVNISKIVR
ncbi:MAG: ATP phosphoribosyltransferase [Candidatus Syntrophoarchaeum butanivorans]|uniref:ATP phosphoribosyltransferase n=2 Tax=Candidatus Syntropharchaeum butanivorans TaxID=1839936 RepID=A0A1F2P8J7_9EURY|nr:MAG: ATP phosphoribosyltransferase [Candidatus Syntrophoarchaeum butanivorans]